MIPVNAPLLDGNEKQYLAECIETGWISSEGPFVARLESQLCAVTGRSYGIAVCNGSLALDIAVQALDLGPGDEVIVPAFTIISCASAVLRCGATPVFVDCDRSTFNMRAVDVQSAITARTKAIMVVHIYGLPVDMDPIMAIARRHGCRIIEDAAEMLGQVYRDRACGSFGDISTFSFYPNKHVTTGEGGMVLTDDPNIAERCRSLRNLCFQAKRFVHEEIGWNARMSNLQAAVGVAQCERLAEFLERKRRMGSLYQELLGGTQGIQLPLESTDYARNIYWVFPIVLDESVHFDASELARRMSAAGIGTRPFFYPLNKQPVFLKNASISKVELPTAERIAAMGLYIPSGLAITPDEQVKVVSRLKSCLRG